MVVRLRTQHYTSGQGPSFVTTQSGRNFLDQSNNAMLVLADSPWSLAVRLTTTEMGTYFADRQARGYNAVGIYLICGTNTAGFDSAGSTYDSLTPLGSTPDFSNASSQTAYWARMDTMLTLAQTYGQTVFLFPAEHQSWGSFVVSQGSTKCTDYGTFLGNRYKTYPNIVWMFGDDYPTGIGGNTWATEDPRYLDILSGIQGTGDTHLVGLQLDAADYSFSNPTWDSHISLSTSYTYQQTYDWIRLAYADAQVLPCGLIEAGYELEGLQGTTGSRLQMRHQTGWAFLEGAAYCFYGHRDIWQFDTGGSSWTTALSTAAQNDNARVIAKLASLDFANWTPDTGTTFITSGRGTYNAGGTAQTGDYCSICRTALLAVVYMPTSRSFTLNTGLLTGTVTGYWYDPTDGSTVTYTGATHPGNNSAGDGDWYLILAGT